MHEGSVGQERKVVLIIENDPGFAGTFMQTAGDKGCEALIAKNGEQGLALAKAHIPSAIILDISLPDITGLDLYRKLIEDHSTCDIPVYFMSVRGKSNEDYEKGAMRYLMTPITQDRLCGALDEMRKIFGPTLGTLLVVEDDEAMREYLSVLLKPHALNVIAVSSAEEGLEKIKKHDISGMIMDVILPGMSGIEMLDAIAADHTLVQPPVVVYSGAELTDDNLRHLALYTDTFIKKNSCAPEKLFDDVLSDLFGNGFASSQSGAEGARSLLGPGGVASHKDVLKSKRVLVVDDDPRNTFALSLLLKQMGMKVSIAENGKEAIDVLMESGPFDMVLMDIMMPVMDGYEAISRIRQMPQFFSLPIIAVTAKIMKEDRDRCLAIGANDFLLKPIEAGKLFSMMEIFFLRGHEQDVKHA